ncbi:Sec-independent protein translocase TatB, partial [Salmonella enterica subsp. enterica serovar Meleagridis]
TEQKPEPVKDNVPDSSETASLATIDAEKKSSAPVVESSHSSSDKP